MDFALLLYDEFDGAPIRDVNVQFMCGGLPLRPLHKRDGHYVFTGPGRRAEEIEVLRPRYHPYLLRVGRRAPGATPAVVPVRLRREMADVWRDCAWISAQGPPGCPVLALGPKPAFHLHAVQKDGAPPGITIAGSTLARLPGRRFAPAGGTDTMVVTGQLAPGSYTVDALPKKAKEGMAFVRAWLNQSGPDGRAYVPVEPTDGAYPGEVLFFDEERSKWAPVCATAPA